MEISNPRRILAVSRPDSGLVDLVKGNQDITAERHHLLTNDAGLTGTAPSLTTESIAGTTHTWSIKTNYYTASIPIWLDEISEPETWAKEFLAPEAREVLTVLGAFVVCFRKPVDEAALKDVKELLGNVAEVVKEGCGYAWDGVCLAIAMPQSSIPYLEKSFDDWEEMCQEFGFEFVDFESKGRNEFAGRPLFFADSGILWAKRLTYSEPLGIERLKEALEANEWEGGDDLGGGLNPEDLDAGDDDEAEGDGNLGFGIEDAEMEMEMFGMKQAIYGGGLDGEADNEDEAEQEQEVEKLQAMMLRMQAVRGMFPP